MVANWYSCKINVFCVVNGISLQSELMWEDRFAFRTKFKPKDIGFSIWGKKKLIQKDWWQLWNELLVHVYFFSRSKNNNCDNCKINWSGALTFHLIETSRSMTFVLTFPLSDTIKNNLRRFVEIGVSFFFEWNSTLVMLCDNPEC